MSEKSEKEIVRLSENVEISDDPNNNFEESQNLKGFFEILYEVAKREGLSEAKDNK